MGRGAGRSQRGDEGPHHCLLVPPSLGDLQLSEEREKGEVGRDFVGTPENIRRGRREGGGRELAQAAGAA